MWLGAAHATNDVEATHSMSQSRLFLTARKPETHHIASILDPLFDDEGLPTALFADHTTPGMWVWSVYVDGTNAQETRARIIDHLGGDGFALSLEEEVLDDVDWVAETLRQLSPVSAGRFYVHGSHDRDSAAKMRLPIEIDAGLAFGTGHHGTTAGCLDMLEQVLKRVKPQSALDLGTGSGVLAIALAKATRIPVLATDIDPVSVRTARENSRLNGTAAFTHMATAAGFHHGAFARYGPFDLVLANILARPLQQLANPMAAHLKRGANIILSGLLPHQQARIVAAYRQQGIVFVRSHIRDGWLTLWLRRP